MSAPTPGKCRFCGCTESNACKLPDGDPCAWFDRERTVCSTPRCIVAFLDAQAKAERQESQARPKRRTPADIHQLQLEERRAKRKAARARTKGRVA